MPFILAGRPHRSATHPPFVIAEMSGNHNQSLDRALAIVDAAAACRRARAEDPDLHRRHDDARRRRAATSSSSDPGQPVGGRVASTTLYQEAYTPWEWHEPIFERARAAGHDRPFSTPFDETAVDFLEALDVPLLQDRVVREHRPAADPQGRRHRQADHHLDRHGDRRRSSTRPCAPRARPAAATWCCSSAPAPIRRRRRTPTCAPSRTCASCSAARSGCRTTRWASASRSPAWRSAPA